MLQGTGTSAHLSSQAAKDRGHSGSVVWDVGFLHARHNKRPLIGWGPYLKNVLLAAL